MPESKAAAENPLEHAWRIQKDAAAVGFDWPDIQGVFDKLHEEIREVQEALQHGLKDQAQHELGDLLFSAVNLARFLDADPNEALARTNARFERRFAALKDEVAGTGRPMEHHSLEELDVYWDAIKKRGY